MIELSLLSLGVAFLAGVTTFFATCFLPLIPTYLAYLTGVTSMSDLNKLDRWRVMRAALGFVLGFGLVFMILGFSAQQVGNVFAAYRNELSRFFGVVIIALGLLMLDILPRTWLSSNHKLLPNLTKSKLGVWFSPLVGVTFALSWTPCIGPVLAVILFQISRAETSLQGGLLMLLFTLGLSLPFLFVAMGFGTVWPRLKRYQNLTSNLRRLAGVVMVVSGILLVLGLFQFISGWLVYNLGLARLVS